MSNIGNKGDQSTSTEVIALANLTALAAGASGTAIQKTGTTTFANVAIPATVGSFIDGEVVSGSVTTFVLASTPILGSEKLYAYGGRLSISQNDYSIIGRNITTMNSIATGQLIADYRTV